METSVLLNSLQTYYRDNKNSSKLIEILKEENKISLRIIDWFVTNYSKKHFIEYIIQDKIKSPKRNTLKKTTINKISQKNNSKYTSSNRQFNVFLSYRSQLNAYSKKQFDPFCRRNRIDFYFNETQFVTTTVGQLNFFRWALSNNVIDYILKNYEEIEVDMNLNTKKNRIQNLNKDEEKPLDALDIKNIVQSELKTKAKKERKKRQPLSVAATNNMNKNNNPVLVSFD